MKKWTSFSGYTPLLSKPDARAPKINGINVTPNAVLECTGLAQNGFEEVIYQNYVGWVLSANIEPYYQNLPVNVVDGSGLQTADKFDFAQYLIYGSKKQVNLCGQWSIAASLGLSIGEVLERWQQKDLSLFTRVMNWNTSKIASGTSDGDLQRLYSVFGVSSATLQKYPRYTPQTLYNLRGAIVSVHVDGVTGRPRGSGILHWVLIRDVYLERCGYGYVTYYNSLYNGDEIISYPEFVASARIPYGVIKL